ncbi:capping protein, Arp2/3 and myosin-I linker protein 3 isoform X5 [Dermochelys coriacea]|uniref:capping protein, Arp2/3 and myosin-I linker protein 3 isoform X5 n=1 Tax=Dermochelys coriacea TaxID=27794 RepID=UPI001CA90F47|nr:capping protein, Arp2/3 and myosin-I linker protein 3 isoform X5 [Dermochelys coriacea]
MWLRPRSCHGPAGGRPRPGPASIRKVLSRPPNPLLLKVKLETKPKKFEDRVLVLTAWRLHLFGLKVPAKVESSFNVLEIRTLNTINHSQILVDTEKATYSFKFPSPASADQVTRHVNAALGKIFPSPTAGCLRTPETPRDTSPNSESSTSTSHSICGGFSETYAALCDYNGLFCREEVQWDVDTIYHSADNHEFNLLDFSHLESRDLALIVAALAYNPWFTRLHCKDLRLGSEVSEQVLHTLSKSHHLEELVLDNTGLKTDFALKLTYALGDNPGSALHSLVLSHNQIEDKGLISLSQQFLYFPKGLRQLGLCKTGVTPKGLAGLCQTLGANPAFSSSLQHLDLSKNPGLLGGEEANGFYSFLAQPNALLRLELAGTDCAVDVLFGALLHGCCTRLSYLNLSRNTFSHRKAKDSQLAFRQFFSSTYALNYVSLSGTKMPLDALRSLFQGLSANTHLSDVHLDLSGCELRSPGAQVLQEQLPGVTALGSLDISDNSFDSDLLTLVPALGKNKSLKHLWLGKNFSVKSRMLEEILHKIVQLIQEEDCSLQSLSMADSRLKSRTSILINALGSNTCLSKVDLSGNGMEDLGAKMLSKALQINSSLRSITWDRNNTTALGFHDVARALENNYTLKYMSFPMSDITAAYRSAPERMDEVWQKIQWCLLRNGHSQKFSQEQAFRLQQGIGTSSAEQQMIRRLCLRVQEEVRALHSCPADTVQEEVLYARELMKEAKNSRALFPSLYELGHILASDGPVRQRLESVANEVSKAVDKELQVILESMVTLTQELCPRAMQAAEGHNKMLGTVSERVTVPRNFIRGALLEQAGQDIQNKLNEVKLSVVTYLTNSIVEELLEELYSTHKSLTQHIAHLQQLSEGQSSAGSSGGTPLDQPPRNQLRDHEETTDDELGTSIDTIAIKRQKHGRKIRPVSAFIGVADPDTDATHSWGTNSPSGWLSSSASSQYSHSRSPSFEGLAELPTEGSRLEHRTRGRPRPPRCVPPGPRQNEARTPGSIEPQQQENGTVPRLDEGLEEFFSRRVLTDNTSYPRTPRGCGVRPGPSDALPPMQKKRRKGLFHFRRNRSLKGEREVEDTLWGAPHSSPSTPQGTADEPKAPMWSSASLDEGEGQEPQGMGIPLPGMGGSGGSGVKGLPPRGNQCPTVDCSPNPMREESDSSEAELLQPSRVHGIALPGMGRSLDGKKEGTELQRVGSLHDRERRRSSDSSEKGGWRPQPPPQSSKPAFVTIRRAEASWDIAEESSQLDLEETDISSRAPRMEAGEKPPNPSFLASGKAREPPSGLRPPKPVGIPRGQKPPTQPERSQSSEEQAGGAGPIETRTSPPVTRPRPDHLETEGGSEVGRKAAPLKPQRTRRAQSCDKLESDQGREPGARGAANALLPDPPLPPPLEQHQPPRKPRLPISRPFLSVDQTVGTQESGTD